MSGDVQTILSDTSDSQNTSEPSVILPEVAGLAQLSDVGESLSTMVFLRLKDFRNNFDALRSEEKRIESAGEKLFCHLDTILEQKLTTMERDTKISQKRRQSLSKEKKTDNSNKQNSRKSQSCPKEERGDEKAEKIDQEEEQYMDLENIPQQKTQVRKSEYLVSKQKQKPLEVFVCLLCFRENKQEYIWKSSEQYLFHIYEKHQIEPDFQALLRSQVVKIPFSHIFYKGTLTNILHNRSRRYFNILYLIKNKSFDKLFSCGCNAIFSRIKIFANNFSFFDLEADYLEHIKKVTHKDKSSMSHVVKKAGSIIFLQKNSSFDIEQHQDKTQKVFMFLKEKMRKYSNWTSFRRLLRMVPMNMLEIISCNPGLISPELSSGFLADCSSCSDLFYNSKQLFDHQKKKHGKVQQKRYIYTKDMLYKLSQLREKNHSQRIVRNINQLTTEEQSILNSHLFLIKQQFLRKPYGKNYYRAMVCGHCKAFFADSGFEAHDYLLHVYLEHDTLHPLNTHYLKFAQKLPNDSIDSEEEGDGDE